jgi:hypothetical protein
MIKRFVIVCFCALSIGAAAQVFFQNESIWHIGYDGMTKPGGATSTVSGSGGIPANALLNNATGALLLNNASGATLLNNAP